MVCADAQLVWLRLLALAASSPPSMRKQGWHVPLRRGRPAAVHLLAILGGTRHHEGRILTRALTELEGAGYVRITEDAIEICDWREFAPRGRGRGDSGDDGGGWLRVEAIPSPGFAELPWLTRSFAHLLLRLAGPDGTVTADPERIVERLGWRYERHLRRAGYVDAWLDELYRDGYLVPHERPGFARVRNFERFQPGVDLEEDAIAVRAWRDEEPNYAESADLGVRTPSGRPVVSTEVTDMGREEPRNYAKPDTFGARSASVETAVAARSCDERGTNGARTGRDDKRKYAESADSGVQERKKEIRSRSPLTPQGGARQAGFDFAGRPAPAPARARQPETARPVRRKLARAAWPPGGVFPTWFERDIWLRHPGRGPARERGSKPLAYGQALALLEEHGITGEALADAVATHLAWKVRTTSWRAGRGVVDVCRYLFDRPFFYEEQPVDEAAYADPAVADLPAWRRSDEQRKAAERSRADAETRAIEAEHRKAVEAARRQPSEKEQLRARALQFTNFHAHADCCDLPYHEPASAEARDVWEAVFRSRLPEYRKAHPEIRDVRALPRIFRDFLALHPEEARRYGYTGVETPPARKPTPSARPPASRVPPTSLASHGLRLVVGGEPLTAEVVRRGPTATKPQPDAPCATLARE